MMRPCARPLLLLGLLATRGAARATLPPHRSFSRPLNIAFRLFLCFFFFFFFGFSDLKVFKNSKRV